MVATCSGLEEGRMYPLQKVIILHLSASKRGY